MLPSRFRSMALVALAFSTVGLAGCATTRVRHYTAKSASPATYETFQVIAPKVGMQGELTDLVERRLDAAMAARGYRPSDAPDLVVSYKLLVDSGVATSALAESHPLLALSNLGANGANLIGAEAGAAGDKVLLVFIQDRVTYDVLWVGWAQGVVTSETLDERVNRGLSEIIVGIPRFYGPDAGAQKAAAVVPADVPPPQAQAVDAPFDMRKAHAEEG